MPEIKPDLAELLKQLSQNPKIREAEMERFRRASGYYEIIGKKHSYGLIWTIIGIMALILFGEVVRFIIMLNLAV
jgi:hypothetical protein